MVPSEYLLHSPNSSAALSKVQRGAETTMMSPVASSPGWASRAAPEGRQRSMKTAELPTRDGGVRMALAASEISPPSFWGAPISLRSHLLVSTPTFSPSLTKTRGSICSDTQQGQLTLVQPRLREAPLASATAAFSCCRWPVLQLPPALPPSPAGWLMVSLDRKMRRRSPSSSTSSVWTFGRP